MSEELKACPFCGSEGIFIPKEGIWYACQCNNCTAEGRSDLGESGAIENWNTRPIEDLLRKQLKVTLGALLSYKYGNSSPDLAEEILAEIEKIGGENE